MIMQQTKSTSVYKSPNQRGDQFFLPWAPKTTREKFSEVVTWKLSQSRLAKKKMLESYEPQIQENALDLWKSHVAALRVMWLGHASFMIQLDGRTFVIDPVLGDINFFTKRAVPLPFDSGNLPSIDVIVLTHGHFDHLDTKTLDYLGKQNPQAQFYLPLGMRKYLSKGLQGRATEFNWWDDIQLDSITCTFLPSQHWHQRSPFDYNKALWGGWWFQGERESFYHTGDSGYFGGFKAIHDHMGRPTAMTLPMGAYAPRWLMKAQHMNPEEAIRAWTDVEATYGIPMHYGTFDLSDEPLDYGVREARDLISKHPERHTLTTNFIKLGHGGSAGFEDCIRQK